MTKNLLAFVLLIMFSAIQANAASVFNFQNGASLTKVKAGSDLRRSSDFSTFSSGNLFSFNRKQLQNWKIGDVAKLTFQRNEQYEGTVSNIVKHQNGDRSFILKISSEAQRLPVVITLGKTHFFVRAITPEKTYVMAGKDDVGLSIDEAEMSTISSTISDYIVPNHPPLQDVHAGEALSNSENKSDMANNFVEKRTSSMFSDEQANIDVLFVYTDTVDSIYGEQVDTKINHWVAITNQIYDDSGVFINMRVAGTMMVEYPELAYPSALVLEKMKDNGHSAFNELANRRYETGADLVVMVFDSASQCGLANLNGFNGTLNSLGGKNRMYSYVAYGCEDYVLAHETGHNLGLAHSRRQMDEDIYYGSFPYALGYGIDDKFATVMAYEYRFNAAKVYQYSNPDKICSGLPCGVDRQDQRSGADAAFALNLLRFEAEELFEESPDLTLISQVLPSIPDANLTACIEARMAETGKKYVGAINKLACENSDIHSLVGIEHFNWLDELNLYGNAISDLSPVSQLSELTSLSIGGNKIEDISPLSSLNKLTRLWLTGNEIRDLSPVSGINSLTDLSAENNEIIEVDAIAGLNKLHSLTLGGNQIVDIQGLAANKNLKNLSLPRNNIVNIDVLASLPNLGSIDLDGNRIDDISVFAQLPKLITINIGWNNISDIGYLENQTAATSINIGVNNISDISVLAKMKKLQFVSIGGNPITSLEPLKNLRKLRSLSAYSTLIERADEISNSPLLESLDLSNTAVTDISFVKKLVKLRTLSLNNFMGTDLDSVSYLKKLSTLSLEYSSVSDISPILGLNENWHLVKLFGSEQIYCWQIDYFSMFESANYFEFSNCDDSQDEQDYDGDGQSNRQELDAGHRPFEGYKGRVKIKRAVPFDYDGDSVADIVVRRPGRFFHYIRRSSDQQIQDVFLGKNKFDIPVSGDFDGDGIFDVAVRRPSTSYWYIMRSSDKQIQREFFGRQKEDIPVLADYDGDGKTDLAVRRPSTKTWYIKNSSDGSIQRIRFGLREDDIPVPADYDGDGIVDLAFRRPSNLHWYIRSSLHGDIQRRRFGLEETDIPVPADYDGDGIADMAFARPSDSKWVVLRSSDAKIEVIEFDFMDGDIPMPADYDGDGKADLAVRRPNQFYQLIRYSSSRTFWTIDFGDDSTDIPVAAPILKRIEMLN